MSTITYKTVITNAINGFNLIQNSLSNLNLFDSTYIIDASAGNSYTGKSINELLIALSNAASIKLPNGGNFISGSFEDSNLYNDEGNFITSSEGSKLFYNQGISLKKAKAFDSNNAVSINSTTGVLTVNIRETEIPDGYYASSYLSGESLVTPKLSSPVWKSKITTISTNNLSGGDLQSKLYDSLINFTPTFAGGKTFSKTTKNGKDYYLCDVNTTNDATLYLSSNTSITVKSGGYLVDEDVITSKTEKYTPIYINKGYGNIEIPKADVSLSLSDLEVESSNIDIGIVFEKNEKASEALENELAYEINIKGNLSGSISTAGYISENDIETTDGKACLILDRAKTYNGYVTKSGIVKKETQVYTIEYSETNKCVDFVFKN